MLFSRMLIGISASAPYLPVRYLQLFKFQASF